MTDNEIIRGVEVCINTIVCNCSDCPYRKDKNCTNNLTKDFLDLINRQKAEIERLEKDSKRLKKVQMQLDDAMKMYSTIKTEAVKEFMERLKTKKHECGCNFRKKPVFAVTEEKIDETYKEMAGES